MCKARLYQIVDLGTQTMTREGKEYLNRKVLFTFETEHMWTFTDKEGNETEKPLVVWTEMTFFISKNSKLREFLYDWTWEEPVEDFDISTLLWEPATLNIRHNEWKEWRVYANISSVLPSTWDIDKFNDETLLSLDDFNKEVFDKLPEFIQKKIWNSPEWETINVEVVDPSDDLPI